MKKDPRVYLAHILECADRIEKYVGQDRESFLRNTMAQDAVIRNFEVIGEAAKRITRGFRAKHPEIPWRLMTGFRDVLIHDYEGVDLGRVWRIAKEDLPAVKEAIAKIVPSLEQLERELAGETDDKASS
ncbi:MAG: HepT-like ribonuclease domain-containing protein [Candidatus Binatia bacterium]